MALERSSSQLSLETFTAICDTFISNGGLSHNQMGTLLDCWNGHTQTTKRFSVFADLWLLHQGLIIAIHKNQFLLVQAISKLPAFTKLTIHFEDYLDIAKRHASTELKDFLTDQINRKAYGQTS